MTRLISGRIILSSEAAELRRFAETNLLTVHSRARRAISIVRAPRLKTRHFDGADLPELTGVRDVELLIEDGSHSEWILLRDYDDARRGRHTLFLFPSGATHPDVVAKIGTGPGAGSLRAEAEVLRQVANALPLEFTSMLPQVVHVRHAADAEILVQSAVEGTPLWLSMQRSVRARRKFGIEIANVGRWLGAFQRQTRRDETTAESMAPAVAESPLRGTPVAPVSVHGDFWARNILVVNRRVSGVVDWENAQITGPPWRDLFDFAFLFASSAPSWRSYPPLHAIRRALLGRGAETRILRGYFESWRAEARIDAATLRAWLDLYLTEAAADAGKEASRWRSNIPWNTLLSETAGRSLFVFSG